MQISTLATEGWNRFLLSTPRIASGVIQYKEASSALFVPFRKKALYHHQVDIGKLSR